MFKLISLFSVFASAYGLYHDRQNRKKFLTDFMTKKCIGDKQLINCNTTDLLVNTEKPIDIDHRKIIYDSCTYTRKPIKYTNYLLGDSNDNRKNLVKFYQPIKMYDCWEKSCTCKYISPTLMFDNHHLVFRKDTIIHYNRQNIKILNQKKFQVEKYIRNNSRIAIFAEKMENKLVVEYIGKQSSVVNDIAYNYYGISNHRTMAIMLFFGISIFVFGSRIRL